MAESSFGEPLNLAVNCAGIVVAKKTLSRKRDSSEMLCHSLPDFQRRFKSTQLDHFIHVASPAGSTKDGVSAAAAGRYHCAFREIANRVWSDNRQ